MLAGHLELSDEELAELLGGPVRSKALPFCRASTAFL
eukprot:SAG22_NODE_1069_length_5726_cov_20.690954_4_plen_37_part_00